MSGIVRLFGSSTFWSALVSLLASILCQSQGVSVDPIVTASVPIAVGVKEAARHYGTAMIAKATVHAAEARRSLFNDLVSAAVSGKVPTDAVAGSAATSRFAREG